MSTPANPGWYDDPQDADQLRYFDGVIWTDHTAPRTTRRPQPQQDATTPAGQAAPTAPAVPTARGWQSPGSQSPSPQFPGAPQPGQWNTPPQHAGPAYAAGRVTPDGAPLAGYGLRVLAFLLDWLLQALVSGVLGGVFLAQAFGDYLDEFRRQLDAVESGSQVDTTALLDSIDARGLALFTVVSIVVFAAYQVLFLTRSGQTPGKMATGISVRRADRPGRPPLPVVLRRVGFAVALFVVQSLPLVGVVGLLGRVVDLLFPSWDARRQALHDKAAGTVVVVGRQPRD